MSDQALTRAEEDALILKAEEIKKARSKPPETAMTRALGQLLSGLHPRPREELIFRFVAGEFELWKYRFLGVQPNQANLDPDWRRWLESKFLTEEDKEWVPFLNDLITFGDYEIDLILRDTAQN